MKQLLLPAVVAMLLASCGGNSGSVNSVVPATEDDIVTLAKNAAQIIANTDRTDTFAVQTAIMDARAQRSALAIAGDEDGARAYDEALQNELRRLDSSLCDTIFATHQ